MPREPPAINPFGDPQNSGIAGSVLWVIIRTLEYLCAGVLGSVFCWVCPVGAILTQSHIWESSEAANYFEMRIQLSSNSRTRTCMHACTHAHMHACTPPHTHARTHTPIHPYIHAPTQPSMHVWVPVCARACASMHLCICLCVVTRGVIVHI